MALRPVASLRLDRVHRQRGVGQVAAVQVEFGALVQGTLKQLP